MSEVHQYGFLTRVKKYFFPTAYDKAQKKLFEERVAFYRQFVEAGDLCFDIGANYGNRTAVFLALKAKVVALDPQKSCYDFLKKKYGGRIVVLQKGAGAQPGFLDFFVNETNSQVSTFSHEWINDLKQTRFAGNEWNRTEKVEVTTLDALIDEYGEPQFIKIDVEGFEPEVIKGLSKPFHYLSFEYAVPEKLDNLLQCLELLRTKYKNLQANYAKGEDPALHLDKWLSIDEMIEFVQQNKFTDSFAGDIYIKSS